MASASTLASTLARELFEVNKLGAFFDIIHQDPDFESGQIDCRALGRRAGWLSGRQLPSRLDRVERQVPRHSPTLLERGRRHGSGVCHAILWFERLVRTRWSTAVCKHQLRDLSRWLHDARPRHVQRKAQRSQQRREPRRHQRQRQLELRRRRGNRRSEDQRACVASRSATYSPRCCSRKACR